MRGGNSTDFEWDEAKSRRTHRLRGISFHFASRLFDPDIASIEEEDQRKDYGEQRLIRIGEIDDVVVTVVWTQRAQTVRIIAAWPSSNQERRRFYEHYPHSK